ncbi:MAG: hypothetical protein WA687_03085 [Solirubrobacterales bacterium]
MSPYPVDATPGFPRRDYVDDERRIVSQSEQGGGREMGDDGTLAACEHGREHPRVGAARRMTNAEDTPKGGVEVSTRNRVGD